MISRTVEYAVRAVVWLAASPRRPQTARQIADAIAVPPGYLAKVMQFLRRAGLVQSQPGPGGGFLLVRDPRDVALLTIVEAVNPIPRIRECPMGRTAHAPCLCPLHAKLDAAYASLERTFATCTLAELLAESEQAEPLCTQSPAEPGISRAPVPAGRAARSSKGPSAKRRTHP